MKVTMSLRFEVSKDCEFYSFAALRIHVSPECRNVLLQLGGYHLIERGPVSMKVYIYTYIRELLGTRPVVTFHRPLSLSFP